MRPSSSDPVAQVPPVGARAQRLHLGQAGLGPPTGSPGNSWDCGGSGLWTPGWAWGLPLLALAGLGTLWQRQRAAAVTLGSLVLLGVWAGAVYNQTPEDNRWLCLIFALPGTLLLATLAGLGLAFLASLPLPKPRLAWGLAVALALPSGAAVVNFGAEDRGGDYVGWDFAHDLALGIPNSALYLAEGDYHTLPLLYAQAVEGRRNDVLSVLNDPLERGALVPRPSCGAAIPRLLAPAAGPARRPSRHWPWPTAERRPPPLGRGALQRMAPQRTLQRHRGSCGSAAWPARPARCLDVGKRPDLAAAWAARGTPPRQGADLEPVEAALLPW